MTKFNEVKAANFLVREVMHQFPESGRLLDNFGLVDVINNLGVLDEQTSQDLKDKLDAYHMYPKVPEDEYARAREVTLTLNDALILLAVWGRFVALQNGEKNLPYETEIKTLANTIKYLIKEIDAHYVPHQSGLGHSLQKSAGFAYVSSNELFWDWSGLDKKEYQKGLEYLVNFTIKKYLDLPSIYLESDDD